MRVRSPALAPGRSKCCRCAAAFRPCALQYHSVSFERASSELHFRHFGRLFRYGEVLHGFGVAIEDRTPPTSWNSHKLRVAVLHCGNVITPRYGDAVLSTFELRLQREEVLVRLEIWVFLGNCKQPTKRAGELSLHFLEFLKGFRIGEDVWRDLHLRRLSPRLGYVGQDLTLLGGEAFHRLDEIGN